MNFKKLASLLLSLISTAVVAADTLSLQNQPGFFRFSYDNVKMPHGMQSMGLLGLSYFANLTPQLYAGIESYGSVTGTQGGFFVLGAGGGVHYELFPHWWGNMDVSVGGGGGSGSGKSSLVGGGLMLRPSMGIEYSWQRAVVGLHYSYINFPSGTIRSKQIGLDIDIPWDFYYLQGSNSNVTSLIKLSDIALTPGKFLDFQRNDFLLLLQTYNQHSGTKNKYGMTQDGTIGLIGAELEHYVTDHIFWYFKSAGAFSGNPNGYMDVFAGLGSHLALDRYPIALIPKLGIGAGGGGRTDTGGGVLIQPQLGLEFPLSTQMATRFSGGYLWAPHGQLKAPTATGEIIYHLDIATAANSPSSLLLGSHYSEQNWRLQLFNQTYFHPQRIMYSAKPPIQLIAFQADQFFSPHFFLSYQAASAYRGKDAGGYASGMIGAGLQTQTLFHDRVQLLTELLIGAGGGGGLAMGGGALMEPVVGLNYTLSPAIGLEASIGQLKALRHDLNTPIFNLGVTIKFNTLLQSK